MKNKKLYLVFPILTILITTFLAFYFYNKIPTDTIASHWGINGQADGYSSKSSLFVMPGVSVIMLILFLVLPKIDPYKKNFLQFEKYFNTFINVIFLFFFYIYILTLVWNLGNHFNMTQFMMPAISLLLYYAGVLISHAKRNWFVGIRTPWTLTNQEVWDKTHKIGAKLFKAIAVISLLILIIPNYTLYIFLIPLLSTVVFLFAYSYFQYKKIKS
jgi:immunity protein, SdpI family